MVSNTTSDDTTGGGWDAEGIAGFLFILQIPLTLITAHMLYRQRHVHPIKGRYPRLVILFGFVSIPGCLVQGLNPSIQPIPCFVYWWLVGLLLSAAFLIMLIRTTTLLFRFEITADCLSIEQPGTFVAGGVLGNLHQSINTGGGGGTVTGTAPVSVNHSLVTGNNNNNNNGNTNGNMVTSPMTGTGTVVAQTNGIPITNGALAPPSPMAMTSSIIGGMPPPPPLTSPTGTMMPTSPPPSFGSNGSGHAGAALGGNYMSFSGIQAASARAPLQLVPPSPANQGNGSVNNGSSGSSGNNSNGGASSGSSPHRVGHLNNGSSGGMAPMSNNGNINSSMVAAGALSPGRASILAPSVNGSSAGGGSLPGHISAYGSGYGIPSVNALSAAGSTPGNGNNGTHSPAVARVMTIDVTPAGIGHQSTGNGTNNAYTMIPTSPNGIHQPSVIMTTTGTPGGGGGVLALSPGGRHTPSNGRRSTMGGNALNPAALHAWKPNWFTRHRHWMRPRWLLKWGVSSELFYLSTFVLMGAAGVTPWGSSRCGETPGWEDDRDHDPSTRFTYYCILIALFYGVVLIALMIVVAVRLSRHANDGYGLKNEFKMMAVGIVIAIVIAMAGVRSRIRAYERAGLVLSAWSCFFIIWLSSNCYPLYLAWSVKRLAARKIRAIEQATRLEDILELPESFEAFLKFCVREFTSENLLFWQRCTTFKNGITQTIRQFPAVLASNAPAHHQMAAITTMITRWLDDADLIYATYMAPNAMFQVNVSHDEQRKPRQRLRQLRQRLQQLARPGAMMLISQQHGTGTNVNGTAAAAVDGVSPLASHMNRKLGGTIVAAASTTPSSNGNGLPPPTLVVTGATTNGNTSNGMITNGSNGAINPSLLTASSPKVLPVSMMRTSSTGGIATASSPPGPHSRLTGDLKAFPPDTTTNGTASWNELAKAGKLNQLNNTMSNAAANGNQPISGRLGHRVTSKGSNGSIALLNTPPPGASITASLPGSIPRRSVSAHGERLLQRTRSYENKTTIPPSVPAAITPSVMATASNNNNNQQRPATANVASILLMNQRLAAAEVAAASIPSSSGPTNSTGTGPVTNSEPSPSAANESVDDIMSGSITSLPPSLAAAVAATAATTMVQPLPTTSATTVIPESSDTGSDQHTPPMGPLGNSSAAATTTLTMTNSMQITPRQPLLIAATPDPADAISEEDDDDDTPAPGGGASGNTVTAPMLSGGGLSSHSPQPQVSPLPPPKSAGGNGTTAATMNGHHTIARSISRAESASEYSVYLPSAVGQAAVTQAPPHVQAETILQELAGVFDSAQTTVMALMRTNSLPRFLVSMMYQQLLQSLRGWVGGGGSRARGQPQYSYLAPASVLHAGSVVHNGATPAPGVTPGGAASGLINPSGNNNLVSQNGITGAGGHMRPIVEDSHGGRSSDAMGSNGIGSPVGGVARFGSTDSLPSPGGGRMNSGGTPHTTGTGGTTAGGGGVGPTRQQRAGSDGSDIGDHMNHHHQREPSMAVDSVISSMHNPQSAAQRSPRRSILQSAIGELSASR